MNTNLSSTHAGNALCCAASLANLNFLTRKTFQKKLDLRVKLFEDRLIGLEKYDTISHVNVKGMVAGIIFKDSKIANKVVEFCMNNGIFPVNTWTDSIKLGPPLTITRDAINEVFDAMESFIRNL